MSSYTPPPLETPQGEDEPLAVVNKSEPAAATVAPSQAAAPIQYMAQQTFFTPTQQQQQQQQFVQQPQGLVYIQPGGVQGVYPQYTYAENAHLLTTPDAYTQGPVRSKHEIPVGQIFGIPLRVHVLLPALTLLYTLLAWMSYGGYVAFLVFWLTGPILWTTVLVHELGHCFAARKVGGTVDRILLWPLGGLAYLAHSGNARHDLIIAISGPLTHGPQAAFWAILFAIGRSNAGARWLFRSACTMQLQLFLFNLCPAYPLDGGRVIVDLMRIRGVAIDRAGRICAVLSLLTATAILIWGIVVLNPSLIFVGAWVLSQANELQQKARSGRISEHKMFENYYGSTPTAHTANASSGEA